MLNGNSIRVQMPNQKNPLVDSSGNATQAWWNMLRTAWIRTGSGSGVPNQVQIGIAAAGTTQATATLILLDWNEIDTVASGSGVRLLAVQPGQLQEVCNNGANPLKVYPPLGMQINSVGVNAAYSLAAGKSQIFKTYSTTQIRSL